MPTNVIMPQMGESITEGTLVRWTRKVGERIEKDEILFEIATDKVDAEIPSPASGVLLEILVPEGQTVPIETVVARLGSAQEAAAPVASPAPAASSVPATSPAPTAPASSPAPALLPRDASSGEAGVEELRRTRSSPLVRRMAAEHGVELTGLQGSGLSGRVTKKDFLAWLEARDSAPAPPAREPGAASEASEGLLEPFSPMRRSIARHMVASRETSVHVTTVFEVDFTRVARLRRRHKEDYARRGLSLTYMPFILKAVTQALQEHPKLNASVEGEALRHHPNVNLGVAVALDWGLVVPVVKRAEDLSLSGLARAVADLSSRARAKKLNPEDLQQGTFTITNPGVFGSLFGTPILNQPQVGILCVGAIRKRVVVLDEEEETLGVRSMACLALSFDHRVIDGSDGDRFMARVRELLENFPEEAI